MIVKQLLFVLFVTDSISVYSFIQSPIYVEDILNKNLMPSSLFVLENSNWTIDSDNFPRETRSEDSGTSDKTSAYDAYNVMRFHR